MSQEKPGRQSIPPELEHLAEEVGDFICYWGFKRIHGRIWTHIYLSDDPLDAGQLMARLQVSKALISLSVNDLLNYDVIREAGKSARGTIVYQANPNVVDVILNVLRRREQKMLAQAESSYKTLSRLSPDQLSRAGISPHRLELIGQMVAQAQTALTSLIELSDIDLSRLESLNDGQKVPV